MKETPLPSLYVVDWVCRACMPGQALIPIVGPEIIPIVGSKNIRQHSNKDISVKYKVLTVKEIKSQKR